MYSFYSLSHFNTFICKTCPVKVINLRCIVQITAYLVPLTVNSLFIVNKEFFFLKNSINFIRIIKNPLIILTVIYLMLRV